MTERQLLQEFSRHIKNTFKDIFWYRIPDAPIPTTKKPFDVFCIYNSFAYAFEFKKNTEGLESHQFYSLLNFTQAGGISFLAVFEDGNILFYSIEKGRVKELKYVLVRSKGKYINLKQIFDQL